MGWVNHRGTEDVEGPEGGEAEDWGFGIGYPVWPEVFSEKQLSRGLGVNH